MERTVGTYVFGAHFVVFHGRVVRNVQERMQIVQMSLDLRYCWTERTQNVWEHNTFNCNCGTGALNVDGTHANRSIAPNVFELTRPASVKLADDDKSKN